MRLLLPLMTIATGAILCGQNNLQPPPQTMTAEDRLKWFAVSTYGPRSLLFSGPVSAGWRTYRNRPEEWGPGWEGFGKRYGMRLVNNSLTNGLEASTGAIWGEDPRYRRLGKGSFGGRIGNAAKQTFATYCHGERLRFSSARAIGITGGAFAQNMWMPASVSSNEDALRRIGGGYAGRFVSNMIREFLPKLKGIKNKD